MDSNTSSRSVTIFQAARVARRIWRENKGNAAAVAAGMEDFLRNVHKRGEECWIGQTPIQPARKYDMPGRYGLPLSAEVIYTAAARRPLYVVAVRIVLSDGYDYNMPAATWLDVAAETHYQTCNGRAPEVHLEEIYPARIVRR